MVSSQHVLGYPECKNAKPIIETASEPCPKCGATLQIRKSKKGRKFYICENNKENGSCDYISWNLPSKDKGKKQDSTKKKIPTRGKGKKEKSN